MCEVTLLYNRNFLLRVFIGMKLRFTGTQYANLFIITSTTVVRDGLGTYQKLAAKNVSICCFKTFLIVNVLTEVVKFQEKLFFFGFWIFNLTFLKKS